MTHPGEVPLATRLRQASTAKLLELIDQHAAQLTVREVRQVLRNPFASAEVVEVLAAMPQLLTAYEVRAAIARYPRTPKMLALRFVPGLYWRELMELGQDVRVTPAVRRAAEKYLVQRLRGLAVGEKMTLARRASPAVLVELGKDPHVPVIAALLDNPRLTEEVLLPILRHATLRPQALDLIASHPRWGVRYDVRRALCQHPLTPFRVIFAFLPSLHPHDLQTVIDASDLSAIVVERARELLEAASAKS